MILKPVFLASSSREHLNIKHLCGFPNYNKLFSLKLIFCYGSFEPSLIFKVQIKKKEKKQTWLLPKTPGILGSVQN